MLLKLWPLVAAFIALTVCWEEQTEEKSSRSQWDTASETGSPAVHVFQGLCWYWSFVASLGSISFVLQICQLSGTLLWMSHCKLSNSLQPALSGHFSSPGVFPPWMPSNCSSCSLVITDFRHLRIHSGPGAHGTAAVTWTQTCTPNQVGIPASNQW